MKIKRIAKSCEGRTNVTGVLADGLERVSGEQSVGNGEIRTHSRRMLPFLYLLPLDASGVLL
jgi:hypothetical protein